MAPFVGNGTKVKILSDIKPPLREQALSEKNYSLVFLICEGILKDFLTQTTNVYLLVLDHSALYNAKFPPVKVAKTPVSFWLE